MADETEMTGAYTTNADGEVVADGEVEGDDAATRAMSSLTMRELGIASRRLGHDVTAAMTTEGSPYRWEALAYVAWVLGKRREPDVPADRYLDMSTDELAAALDELAAAVPDDSGSPAENPTERAPAPR